VKKRPRKKENNVAGWRVVNDTELKGRENQIEVAGLH